MTDYFRVFKYIGDGLYVRDDGFHIVLATQRENGIHEVALDHSTLIEFLEFLELSRGIEMKQVQHA